MCKDCRYHIIDNMYSTGQGCYIDDAEIADSLQANCNLYEKGE